MISHETRPPTQLPSLNRGRQFRFSRAERSYASRSTSPLVPAPKTRARIAGGIGTLAILMAASILRHTFLPGTAAAQQTQLFLLSALFVAFAGQDWPPSSARL